MDIWEQDASMAQWSSRMIRASGGFPATRVVKMYVTRVQFPVEPFDCTLAYWWNHSISAVFLLFPPYTGLTIFQHDN